MDINNPIERERLHRVVQGHYRALDPFRKLVRDLVAEFAGSNYGGVGPGPRFQTMIPLTKQMVDAYQMALVANRPRVMCQTSQQELRWFARKFEVAINNLYKEIGIEYTLRSAVLDALFGLGIVKTHMADSGMVQIEEDLWMDPGQPFVSNVSLDNFVYDMGATKFSMCKFAGDAYRIAHADLQNADIYDPEVTKDIKPSTKFGHDHDRVERISKGWEVDQDELEPMVDLIDIWVARDRMIYTFELDRNAALFTPKGKCLAKMPWEGPEHGPYHLLSFNDVPENIMPTSIIADLAELSRVVNSIMRKQSRRARSQKKLLTYAPGAAADAAKVTRAGDDAVVEVLDPKQLGVLQMGGVDAANAQFMTQAMEIFNAQAGNLTALLGLGAQADTVGQEELIHGSVGKKVASMQARVVDFTCRVTHDLAHLLWIDRYKTMPGEIPIEGSDMTGFEANWTPEERIGNFLQYQFDVDVYSMPYSSPAQKANALGQVLNQIMPAAQMLMQQGGTIDFQELVNQYAELYNVPGLKDIIKFTGLPQEMGGGGEQPGMPANTTRTNVRVNRGGGQQGGSDQQAQWQEVGNQQAQAAANAGGG